MSEDEVISIVGLLRTGTSSGHDNICIWSIKNLINLISKTLTHIVAIFGIFTLSGIVPDKLKIAKVMIPLFKSGERKIISIIDLFQYILPGFSKVLEKAVYYRKINYLDINKILVDNQYGFRRNHST